MVPRRYLVLRRRQETRDTVTLALEPVGPPIASCAPGQFNMLYAFGVGESAISVSGDAGEGRLLHTIREVGAVTRSLCRAKRGTMIGIRGPFGTGWGLSDAEGSDIVIIAGGIGLAPLRPAIHQILAERDRFQRVSILLGARSPDLILYPSELQSWQARFDFHVGVTVDHADSAWRGPVGVVTELLPGAPFDPASTMALMCGPEVMMRFAAAALVDRGVPRDRIRVSMERNMKCAIGQCGHCQFGPAFVCKDGPVFPYAGVERLMGIREV